MMKSLKYTLCAFAGISLAANMLSCSHDESENEPVLKDAFAGKFMIGAALSERHVHGADSAATNLITKHFNSIVAENAMKSEQMNPRQDYYNWGPADEFVQFGEDNDMFIVGHCLVWHSQLAPWFAYDGNGNLVGADTLKARMKKYIGDVVGRYKGRVHAWDVVNEAILDDGSYRNSPFYQVLGEEYLPYAFQLAQEADPDAQLYINDYNMSLAAKRARYVEIINDLKARGLRVDAIGMQGHMGMDYPDFEEFEKSIEAFAGTGAQVMLTEWDMSALPTITESADVEEQVEYLKDLNPYPNGLPADVDSLWNARMEQVMDIMLRHSDVVSRVTAWGVTDRDSWKNNWPMKNREEYALWFDRQYKMKPFMKNVVKKLKSNK